MCALTLCCFPRSYMIRGSRVTSVAPAQLTAPCFGEASRCPGDVPVLDDPVSLTRTDSSWPYLGQSGSLHGELNLGTKGPCGAIAAEAHSLCIRG